MAVLSGLHVAPGGTLLLGSVLALCRQREGDQLTHQTIQRKSPARACAIPELLVTETAVGWHLGEPAGAESVSNVTRARGRVAAAVGSSLLSLPRGLPSRVNGGQGTGRAGTGLGAGRLLPGTWQDGAGDILGEKNWHVPYTQGTGNKVGVPCQARLEKATVPLQAAGTALPQRAARLRRGLYSCGGPGCLTRRLCSCSQLGDMVRPWGPQ